jgi:thiol-disulfide isomerase/thioredoxin
LAEQKRARLNRWGWGAVGAVGIVAVAIYVTLDGQSNIANAACASSGEKAAGLDQYAVGQLAAFRVTTDSALMRDVRFQSADGEPLSIADFAGKTVLLNIWATWCPPCREEMPALDQLATTMADQPFAVVPVSLDTTNTPEGPRQFYADYGINSLDLYVDPTARMTDDVNGVLGITIGFPTTVLIDGNGCTLGVIQGPADWSGPDAQVLMAAAIGE